MPSSVTRAGGTQGTLTCPPAAGEARGAVTDLQREAEDALMGLPGVRGVDADVEANHGVIKVLVSQIGPTEIPPTFKGYPTEVVEIGEPTIEEGE
jgi:hypothetical protein